MCFLNFFHNLYHHITKNLIYYITISLSITIITKKIHYKSYYFLNWQEFRLKTKTNMNNITHIGFLYNGGERGIRTPEAALTTYTISNRAP